VSAFVGYSSDPDHRRAQRLALIKQQNRLRSPPPAPVAKDRRRKPRSEATIAKLRAAAHARWDRERELRGLDPVDTSIDAAGNPDFELDLVPDSLLSDR